ncbi:MAG: guanitoxin biosynthesis heme-dependent pre-guanitoxin N-hydroxylase GntA [Candidatus Dormibacteria bacterium]
MTRTVHLPEAAGAQFWPYLGSDDGDLVDLVGNRSVPAVARLAHDAFAGMVSSPAFVCVGAKAAISRGTYRVGMLGELGTTASTSALADGLSRFQSELDTADNDFFSYAAFFSGPVGMNEDEFEAALWRQLRMLNRVDGAHWDPAVSSDPADPRFSFSFGGRAYFIVGLHAGSSRWSRRFAWPTLVFNPHDQFDELRDDGRMPKWQEVIRAADVELQGSPNPNLNDFGELPEARQYSGKANPRGWQCPFHAEQD